jgi:hypothetical protein
MRVRFYCDVPEFDYKDLWLSATRNIYGQPQPGYTRVAFDVDFPDGLLKPYEFQARPVVAEPSDVIDSD